MTFTQADKLKELRKGAEMVADGVNSSLTTHEDVAKAFNVHRYLLNDIALGVLKAVRNARPDPRICSALYEAAELIWE